MEGIAGGAMITRLQPGFPLLRMGAKARVSRPSVAIVLVLCAMLHVVGVCTDEGADEVGVCMGLGSYEVTCRVRCALRCFVTLL